MSRIFYMLLLSGALCCLQACGLFKNYSNTKHLNQHEMESYTSLNDAGQFATSAQSHTLTFTNDSAGHDYSIEIWPKGLFTFSAQKGFEGEAEKLRLRGTVVHTSQQQQTQSDEVNAFAWKASNLEKSHKEGSRLEERAKEVSPSWKGTLLAALALLVLAIGWFLMRGK